MARNFKMFDHVVAPETRYKGWSFVKSRPLESFLLLQFIYMLFSLFSYRSLLYSYLSLIICCFVIHYSDYFMNIIFEKAFGVISEMLRQHSEKMVMAPFMKNPDIDDGDDEDVAEDVADDEEDVVDDEEDVVDDEEDVADDEEDVADDEEDVADNEEDVADDEEDVAEYVNGDVVEGAEQYEDDTDNAVDVQEDMDQLIQETTKGWATGESTPYLELRQRHVPRG